MSLREYNRKRKFDQTPEPPGKAVPRKGALRFVIQLHRATRLHYDFRLEMGGVFKSWAVPRGPSLNPMDQRLAVFVEDHPIPYGSFEGIIPKGNYGAGTVMIWDQGTYLERGHLDEPNSRLGEKAMLEGLEKGHITFVLEGERLQGEFALIRLNKGDERSWLLVKKRDAHATYKIKREEEPRSVASGRTMAEITAQAAGKGEVWLPKRTVSARPAPKPGAKPVRGPELKAARTPKLKRESPKAVAPLARATMPRRVHPMLPRLERAAPIRDGWVFCGLQGGHRALAEVETKRARLYSKRLLSFERKFPRVAEALEEAGIRAILDGELLQGDTSGSGERYSVFDLLYLDGEDLRPQPLTERLRRLRSLDVLRSGGPVQLAPFVEDDGSRLWKQKGVAAILGRDAASAYHGGVSPDWVEIRDRADKPNAPVARRPAKLREPEKRPTPAEKPPTPKHRTEPERKAPLATKAASPGERGPVFSHLDKLYWKRERITKGGLIEYYRDVAPILLPHLADRPMSLHRFPNGYESKGFYQKDYTGYKPRWVETFRLYSETAGKSIDYVVCQNEWTLLHLANLGCIEMNPWLSRTQNINRPDWLVIDLDPDRQKFEQVVEAALEVRGVLEQIGAESYCKTSGATGMHICVPLQGRFEYEETRLFAEEVCKVVQLRLPYTTLERNPARRAGRMYLDFMQNRIGQTLASPYSARPRPGATVSTPLKWSEVTRKLDPTAFTIQTTPKRLARVGDLWAPVIQDAVDIRACLKQLKKL